MWNKTRFYELLITTVLVLWVMVKLGSSAAFIVYYKNYFWGGVILFMTIASVIAVAVIGNLFARVRMEDLEGEKI